MKSLRIATVGLFAALSLAVFAPSASAAQLGQMTPETFEDHKTTLIGVITGPGCKQCPDLVKALEAQSDKNPGVAFMTGDSQAFDIDLADLPVLVVSVPGVGPTYIQKNFQLPADVDAFTNAQIDYAAKEAAAGAAVTAAQQTFETTVATFQAEGAALQAEFQKALEPITTKATPVLQPLAEEMQALMARAQTELTPLFMAVQGSKNETEFNTNKKAFEDAQAKFQAEAEALQAKIKTASEPFQKEAEPTVNAFKPRFEDLNTRASTAIGEAQAAVAAAQEALSAIVTAHRAGK